MDETMIEQPAAQAQPLQKAELDEVLRLVDERVSAALAADKEESERRALALDEREKSLKVRELKTLCEEKLKSRGLPPELSQALSFQNEAEMEPALDALETAFRDAVKKAVEERLCGDTPRAGSVAKTRDLPDDEYYAAVMSR